LTARVRVELRDRSYSVFVGEDSASSVLEIVRADRPSRVVVLADESALAAHESFWKDGPVANRLDVLRLPAGERAKTWAIAGEYANRVLAGGFERGDWIIGFGGGATTDVAGFVASVLLRGVSWAAVPTTLLAQVDASVGGKTGVNAPTGKNLLGAFHQPSAVACSPTFLRTLPTREFRSGLAEVVKTAWIGDPELFEALESDPPRAADHSSLAEIVERCVRVKAEIVSQDEREQGVRETLNFGHTLGHAIETACAGKYLHGESVSLGLVAAVFLSVETDRCEASLLDRVIRLLEDLGLPTSDAMLDTDAVLAQARRDKKRRAGIDRYQLTQGLGLISVARDLPEGAPRAAIEFLRR
jgi:3-dehydroquinate synthase